MKRILIHTREPYSQLWQNCGFEFQRIPVVGEYIATGIDSDWYLVVVVVHAPFDEAAYDAEIYVTRADRYQVLLKAGSGDERR